MSLKRWMAIAMLVAVPIAATAQENSRANDPTDPTAAAVPARYESAFSSYQPMVDSEESPAQTWRAANDEMEKLGGHAGHMNRAEAGGGPPDTPASGQAHHGMEHQSKGK